MKMIESQTLEFKQQLNNDFVKEVIAFLNTNDGIILVGVDDQGYISGLEDSKETLEKISNIISDNIEPNAVLFTKLNIEKHDNKKIRRVGSNKKGKWVVND